MSVSRTTSRRAAEMRSAKSSVDKDGNKESFESGADKEKEERKCLVVSGKVAGVREVTGMIAVLKNDEMDLMR